MYFLTSVRHHLDRELGDSGIGTGRPTAWPLRSLEINSLELLLTGNAKYEIYVARIVYLHLLKSRIRELLSGSIHVH